MRQAMAVLACMALSACSTTPGEVWQKVKYDFGFGEKPPGYEEPADRVKARLDAVGKAELERLNADGRFGEVKYQQTGAMQGRYYKETKVYESYHPGETQSVAHGGDDQRGYVGFIEYTYRIYQGPRKMNRTEAAAAAANIRTELTGRETYRYRFNATGTWTGAKGERVRD